MLSYFLYKIAIKNLYLLQDVDEKLLYDTFSAFGVIVTNPKVIQCLCLLCELSHLLKRWLFVVSGTLEMQIY